MSDEASVRFLGRYAMHGELASGGMATVHLGRLLGPVGFARTVAIKRLHPQFAKDPQFVAMFVDEARIAARIRHQNVVPTLDVVARDGEIFLVMEYVHGESLSRLLAALEARRERVPTGIAAGVMLGVLHGLHAAHEAKTEKGVALEIVHRDVSPQNVLVGVDGIARVLDFGVAKAVDRLQTTEDGGVKGKLGYAAPEQAEGKHVDRRTDVWAASVVLWELLVGRRLFGGRSAAAVVLDVLEREVEAPSRAGGAAPELDGIVMRGLSRAPEERFATAREMALAIESAITPASARAIGDWVEATARDTLHSRAVRVEEMESDGGGKRSSDGSLRRQLAVLGVRGGGAGSEPSSPPPSSEEPTGASPGRVGPSDAPPARAASAPPSREAASERTDEPAAPTAPRRSRLLPAALAIAAAALAAFAIVSGERERPPPPGPAPAASAGQHASAVMTAPAPSSPASAAASAPARADVAPASAPPRSSGAVLSPHASRAPAPVAAVDAGRAAPACDPPYTVGPAPDFIRLPKPECLPP